MPRVARQACLPRGQPVIQGFARATKPGTSLPEGKTALLPLSPSKKRKLNELGNVSNGEKAQDTIAEATTPSKTLRFSELSVSTPRSSRCSPSRFKADLPSCQPQTDNTENLLPVSPSKSKRSSVRRTPHCSSPSKASARPACFADFLNLHASLLKALSLHFAHKGRSAPADLRELLRSVERIWKKRKVVTKDVQRLIWVWEQRSGSSPGLGFRIANYGLGKVCLESVAPEAGRTERFDENELHEQFEQILELLWERGLDTAEGEKDEHHADFVETLGVAPIHESLTPFTVFRKGQQRLQDLKGGVIRVKTESLRAQGADNAAPKVLDATPNRRQGLLDRIKNKELRQSKLPPPPSKETLLRRAAVQRVEEVVGILVLLRPAAFVGSGLKATTTQRKPFSLETIVQHVRDSVRNPISREEVEICLEILARTDVAGHWVNVVMVNQAKSVVLKSCDDVSPKEIAAKASELNIGWNETPCFAVSSLAC